MGFAFSQDSPLERRRGEINDSKCGEMSLFDDKLF